MKLELWEVAESLQAQSKEYYDQAGKGKGAGFGPEGMVAVADAATGLVLINISKALKKAITENTNKAGV